MTTTPEVRALARRIAGAEATAHQRGEQLAHSALEDGAIREFDLEGTQTAQYGKQFDGTSVAATLVSPPPPAPSTPVAVGVPGGFKVYWNGTFGNDITVVAPMDWRQVDVVAGPVGMDPIATPPSVGITSPRGGEVFIPAVAGNYEVALVSRTLAGRPSDPSISVAVTALALVDDAAFQQALEDLTAAEGRLDIAEGDIDDNLTEIEAAKVRITAAEQDVTDALADALTANNAANAAQADADAANALALLAKNTADAAITVFRQASAPASGMATNDLWIDSDDGLLYVWTGSWTLSADQRVATLVTSNASKTSVFAQASSPTTVGRTVGDLWINTDDNDRTYRWDGAAWTLTTIATAGYIASRATDYITNGSGLLKTNQNFATAFDFDASDAPVGASGSFKVKSTGAQAAMTDEFQAYDPAKKLKLAFKIKQTVAGATNRAYGYLAPHNIDGNPISPQHYMWITGTMTTLALPLNPGDTTVKLTSAANWYGSAAKPAGAASYFRAFQFWNYTDGTGKVWPAGAGSYTLDVTPSNQYADGAVDAATGIVTLLAPYTGPARAAGAPVSQPSAGGSYLYMPSLTNGVIPEAWTAYSDEFPGGIFTGSQEVPSTGGTIWTTGMPPGTAKVKVGWLLNYAPSPGNAIVGRHSIAAVSLSDAQAARDRADSAYTLASAKATVYRQSSAPTVGMATNDLWFDTDDGRVYVYTGAWTITDDTRISDALTNAAIALQAAEKTDAVNANPNFSDWSGSLPAAWAAYATAPIKETAAAYVRTPPNAARFNCTDTTTDRGLYHALSDLPIGTEYVTISVDIRAASGTFGGAGVLLDWTGMTNNRVTWDFSADVPAPVALKWYRLTKVLRRPTAATGTQTSWITYLMGQYSAIGTARAIKDISVDRMAVRASSVAEIAAYNAASAATVSSLTTTVDAKTTVFVQASQPSTSGRTIGDLWLDSDDGNKPYDWTGAWTARQFGDSALASMDLNKLVVVGTANLNVAVANEIAAKTAAIQTADIGNLFVSETSVLNEVVAQQIAADTAEFITVRANNLESVMALVTQLTSGGAGRRWEADPDGIRVFEADGSILINFPTDPSTPASFYGDLVATSLTISDQLAIRGLVNEISKGAQVVLAGGTTAPSSPPTVTIDWESKISTTNDADTPSGFDPYRYGWSRYGGHYYVAQGLYGVGATINRYSVATGDRDYWGFNVDTTIWTSLSSVMIGNVIYVLGMNAAGTAYRVQGWDVDTMTKLHDWAYPHAFGTSGTAHRKPQIGTDGTNVLIAFSNYSSNLVQWRVYNKATGAQIGAVGVTNVTSMGDLAAFGITNADFGSSRMFILGAFVNASVLICTAAGVYQANETFPTPTGSTMRGASWDATDQIFVTFDATASKGYRHTGIKWTTESSTWWLSNTWYDGDATGGTHETAQSPRKSFTMKKRARLQLTTAVLPVRPIPNTTDDAKATRIYIGRGAADPGRTFMERITTLADGVRATTLTAVALPAGAAVSPPPATSDFPASSPGRIVSADGTTIILAGDGSANVGGLSVVGASGITEVKALQTTGSHTRSRSPGCMVRKTDAPTIPSNAYTLINWSGHWHGSNSDATVWAVGQPSRFYAPVSGRYNISGMVAFNTSATGFRILNLKRDSAGNPASGTSVMVWSSPGVAGCPLGLPFSITDVYLDAGEYVEMFANHLHGSALAVGSMGGFTSTFSMSYVGNI